MKPLLLAVLLAAGRSDRYARADWHRRCDAIRHDETWAALRCEFQLWELNAQAKRSGFLSIPCPPSLKDDLRTLAPRDCSKWPPPRDGSSLAASSANFSWVLSASSDVALIRAMDALGLADVSHHTMRLRHTGVAPMLEHGINPRVIQFLAGWTSLRMLERYGHVREWRPNATHPSVFRATAGRLDKSHRSEA